MMLKPDMEEVIQASEEQECTDSVALVTPEIQTDIQKTEPQIDSPADKQKEQVLDNTEADTPVQEKQYKELPKAHTTYANIIKSLLPIGDDTQANKDQLTTTTYRVDELKVDRENLNDYRKICRFVDAIHIPPTYFAVLSQSLQMNMMVKEPFPFVMLGLVHVENSVTQYRLVSENEVVSMAVSLGNLRDHEKGQQFDFMTKVNVGEELVWEGISTYLSRSKRKKPTEKSIRKEPEPKLSSENSLIYSTFEVPEDIGRRYAFVSGDFNLIHLHPLSARAFGFPKAIAHGMWSKAKCLAQIKNLPDAFTVDVSFKMPILLPSEVELIINARDEAEDLIMQIGLYSAKNGKPHLTGSVREIDTGNSNV